jgi:5-methylcytosine-specific restriction enzyme subunit McrC
MRIADYVQRRLDDGAKCPVGVWTRHCVAYPDLVWYLHAGPRDRGSRRSGVDDDPPGIAVDAKYNAEKQTSFPAADVLQLPAYCTSLGLNRLEHAKGIEVASLFRILGAGSDGSGIAVDAHSFDLDAEPFGLIR